MFELNTPCLEKVKINKSQLGLLKSFQVDISVGRTVIHRDKAVVLAWNKSQQHPVRRMSFKKVQ